MDKSAERPKKRDNTISFIRGNSIVLSIDLNEKIIKFNEKCKQITGYKTEEVIDKNFLDLLIPSRYFNQWKGVLNSSRKNKAIEDFKLPILTRNGHEIMISWSSFPIKNSSDIVGDIDFVGTFINSWTDSEIALVKLSKDVVESKVDVGDSGEAFLRLLKVNEDLERKNKKLEKNIIALKSRRGKKDVPTSYSGKLVYSFADVVGGRKRRQEFERMMNELDEREKKLNKLESQLLNDKIKVNKIRNEFSEWREKLEILESEIEKRNIDLEDRAKLLDSTIDLGKSIGFVSTDLDEKISSGELNAKKGISGDILNNISYCAAVIQKGILKQVNGFFVDLIGYAEDEVIEKSFFDFIAPEGLLGLEKYYLERLKGGKVNTYDTVFLNSEDQNVHMKVRIKSTFFNGEKAEIAVFTKPGDVVDESEIFCFIETQQEKTSYDIGTHVDEMEEKVDIVEEEVIEPDTLTEEESPIEEHQIETEVEAEPQVTKEETLLVSEEKTEDAEVVEPINTNREEVLDEIAKELEETLETQAELEPQEPKIESETEAQIKEEETQLEPEAMEDDITETEAEPELTAGEISKEEAETEDEKTDTESTKKTENKQKEEDK